MEILRTHSHPRLAVSDSPRISQQRLSTLSLLAAVLSASIAVTGCGGIVSASGNNLTVSSSSVSFGSVAVGTTATDQLTLTNSTSSPIAISSLTVSGAFTADGAGTMPVTLAASGGTLNLNVHFSPTTTGSAAGQLVIASNSVGSPSLTVPLSGTGVAATTALSVNASSVAFGNVTVGAPATQSLTLKSSGSEAVTVSTASITGPGFSFSGATFPLTLNPSQTATLSIQFNPASAGAATGQLTITSNSAANPTIQVGLSGTGEASTAAYQVNLNWNAPTSSSDPVSGYNIYRATGSSSAFEKLNSSVNSPLSFADSTVQGSTTYEYYVTSVDSSGAESVPSNTATIAVP